MKAFLYIRVSTDEQAEKGYSQRSQEEVLNRYCELHNIQIAGTYIEDFSAKTFNRPRFQEMLFRIKKNKDCASLILFTKWDRFSRNAGEAYAMINILEKLGVAPQAIEQPLDIEIPENKLMMAVYLATPEVENARRSLNVFYGMRRARKEGRWMACAPIGYTNSRSAGNTKIITPDPGKSAIIKWIFESLATNKFSAESILKSAREKGFKCSKNNFHSLIRNPVYCGKIKIVAFKAEPEAVIQGLHEGIISEELFYRTQAALDSKKRTTKINDLDKFPLRGFILCPNCGNALTASCSTGRNKKYAYYHCTSQCGARFAADVVNDGFVSVQKKLKPLQGIEPLYKLVVEDVFSRGKKNTGTELRKVKNDLQQLSQRNKKARDLLLEDKISPLDYSEIKKECEQQTAMLDERIALLSQHVQGIEERIVRAVTLLSHLDELYTKGSTEDKRRIAGSMFPKKLTFSKNGYRTAHMNKAAELIFNMSAAFSEIKKGQKDENSLLSHEVIPMVRFSNLTNEEFLFDLKLLLAMAA